MEETGLVKYDIARRALAEAAAVDEVKDIRDKSAAMKAYAKQANDRGLVVYASEIIIRAEKRLGEMIKKQKETVGLADGGDAMRARSTCWTEVDTRPTLAQIGISKNLSARSQAIASIPDEEFEETLAEHREQQEAVTAKTMEALARKGKEQQEKEVKHKKRYPVSDAEQFATMAISQLERIRDDDPNATKELDRVMGWIKGRKERL